MRDRRYTFYTYSSTLPFSLEKLNPMREGVSNRKQLLWSSFSNFA
jgi:hypothetical protein